MKYKIVCVRDRVADAFSVPQFVLNLGAAIRGFGDEVRRPHSDERPNALNQHPEDYDLYVLGEFDDDGAVFTTAAPKQIAIGKDYV